MSDDDMNATPLGKLPAPLVQNNKGKPAVDVPSYRDLLRDMDSQPQAAATAMPATPGPAAPTDYGPQPTYPPAMQPPPQYAPQPPMQYAPQPPPPQYPQPQMPPHHPYHHEYEPLPPAEAPETKQGGLLARLVRANKPTLFVVVIVLLTLVFVGPRLARMQRFAAADGTLNMLGKVTAAALAGGAFRVANALA